MKISFVILGLIALGVILMSSKMKSTETKMTTTDSKSFYDFSIGGLEGETMELSDFKGKYILCVNVASKCGFTPQYKPLQELYEKYQDKLVIIGFPCNQFLMQEPGSARSRSPPSVKRIMALLFPLRKKSR